jgi:hypothetical protein
VFYSELWNRRHKEYFDGENKIASIMTEKEIKDY